MPEPGLESFRIAHGRSRRGAFPCPLVARLWRARVERGISLQDLAELTGYPARTLSGWERGARRTPLVAWLDWAQALGFAVRMESDDD